LYTDTIGSRQVVYGIRQDIGELWCASQAHLIAEIFDEAPDPTAQAFLSSYSKKNPEYWFPGDATLFASTRQLLPNHFLCLKTGKAKRYWPRDRIYSVDSMEAVRQAAEILRGTIEAATHHAAAVPLETARDSCRVLALAVEVAEKGNTNAITDAGSAGAMAQASR